MRKVATALAALSLAMGSSAARAQTPNAGEAQFRALYKELVETNTTLSAGSCTLAAERMAARLKAAGYPGSEVTVFTVPQAPKEGGLFAVLPGKDPKAKAILLLAHIDVVEARREDWERDPFTLIEENGYFYARGASDDKAMASIFTDTMIRLRGEPRLNHTLKLALTCGEETTGVFNGAEWLAQNKRDWIDAAFALNEGGGGRVDPQGRPASLAIQTAEKTAQNYTLEARNPGGHSSMPRPDNAIYDLAAAITRIGAHKFPVHLNPTTEAFFREQAKTSPPPIGPAMAAIAANPGDASAEGVLARDPMLNSMMRTSCVATLVNAGHAENALPQRATANINCRIAPGETIEAVQVKLTQVIGNPALSLTAKPRRGPLGQPAPLDPKVLEPARRIAAEMYPGLTIVPTMSTGATDSIYISAVGIPSYGVPGLLYEPDGGGIHGLNERIRVSSVMKGREYLYRLIKAYAAAP